MRSASGETSSSLSVGIFSPPSTTGAGTVSAWPSLAAAPATADYGRLSVMLQWRYEMEDVLFVPPEAFDPPPKVDSAVVSMVPRAQPAEVDPALLSELVQVAFSQRRKLLRHTLGRWLEQRSFAGVLVLQRRGEEVPVDEYVALAQAVR